MQMQRCTPRSAEEWRRMDDELAKWGRKIDELRARSNKVGQDLVDDLQHRYDALKREMEQLKLATQREMQEACRQIDGLEAEVDGRSRASLASARARTGKALGHMRGGAEEIGQGFSRAWVELRNGFQQAYERLR